MSMETTSGFDSEPNGALFELKLLFTVLALTEYWVQVVPPSLDTNT